MNCSNFTNYLRETKILDYSSKQIQLLIETRGGEEFTGNGTGESDL